MAYHINITIIFKNNEKILTPKYFYIIRYSCCGDFILQQITVIIEKNIRIEDTLLRHEGEEFCCLLPETSIEGATMLAERFRKKISQQAYERKANKISLEKRFI